MNAQDETVPGRELADSLCQAMADIHRRGWCDGTGGNFSCVISREPLQLLMAPSGVDKGSVEPADLIRVDDRGTVLAGAGRASAETALHLTIVAATGAGAVLHTHSQAATLLSRYTLALHRHGRPEPADDGEEAGPVHQLLLEELEMLKGLEGITSHHHQIALPVLANDQDLQRLSEHARPHLAEAPYGLLIGGHGLYAWGRDLSSARRHLEILEFLLEQYWRQLLLVAATGIGALP
ncbi:MAG: methylthioribulose 1-phosphate dehydratase [Synechococcaceae cyanobacterium ELA739]|jgi:methylthioribulose-1-phosphate dehydratase